MFYTDTENVFLLWLNAIFAAAFPVFVRVCMAVNGALLFLCGGSLRIIFVIGGDTMKKIREGWIGLILCAVISLMVGCGYSESAPSTQSGDVQGNETNKAEDSSFAQVVDGLKETADILQENIADANSSKNDLDALLKDTGMGEKNAVHAAISYLNYTAFSRDGLINQLSSEYGEGYTKDEAIFAVDFLEEHSLVDWKEQAIRSANSYLDYTAFSRTGLIKQLSSEYGEMFSEEDATAAVNYLEESGSVNWKEQAVKSAKNYLQFSSFSRSELIRQLSSEYGEGFTTEEAEYAVSQVGY